VTSAPFLQIAGDGGTRPYSRALPLHQTEGLPSLRSPDPTPSPRGRAPDSGSGTTRHGGVPPLLQIAGHVGQRGANKKLTKVYLTPDLCSTYDKLCSFIYINMLIYIHKALLLPTSMNPVILALPSPLLNPLKSYKRTLTFEQ